MSISPTHAHRSNSSSSSPALSTNPASNHGFLSHSGGDIHTSPQISVADQPPPVSDATVSVAADTGGSSKKAVDGQHLILHPLNMKCLLQHYGSYDLLPPRTSGKILQLETVTQTEAMRRRYRYLSHFSLTTTFQLCEIELKEILPSNALLPFMDEIKKRENHRKQLSKKEHQEKVKAEAALLHSMPSQGSSGHYFVEKSFSMDDFEGARNTVKLSFANVMSTNKSQESRENPKMDMLVGKKGKKPSRVLLSTAGGRRY